MGCDIHFVVQFKGPRGWERAEALVPSEYEKGVMVRETWYESRNYDAFGILAGVRRDNFNQIVPLRGLPADFIEGDVDDVGDHSQTWLSLRELLAFDWQQRAQSTGLVNARTFERWDRYHDLNHGPNEYCAGVGGERTKVIPIDEMRALVKANPDDVTAGNLDHLYTCVSWEVTYEHAA